MIVKNIPITIEKSANADFDARFVMSAATPDRVKDTISPAAYKSLNVEKLIALWQHNPDQPVGYWANVKAVGDTLVGDLKLAGTNLGKMIKQLIADEVPLGASIGFRGKGEPNKLGGVEFKTIELMETSIVSIPCHPRALQIAKSYDLEALIEIPAPGQTDDKMRVTMERAAAALQKSAASIHLNPWG